MAYTRYLVPPLLLLLALDQLFSEGPFSQRAVLLQLPAEILQFSALSGKPNNKGEALDNKTHSSQYTYNKWKETVAIQSVSGSEGGLL